MRQWLSHLRRMQDRALRLPLSRIIFYFLEKVVVEEKKEEEKYKVREDLFDPQRIRYSMANPFRWKAERVYQKQIPANIYVPVPKTRRNSDFAM